MNQDVIHDNLMFLAGLNQDIYADNGMFEGLSSSIATQLAKLDYVLSDDDVIFTYMKQNQLITIIYTITDKLYEFSFLRNEKKVNLESVSKAEVIKVEPIYEQQTQSFGSSEVSFSVLKHLRLLFANHDMIDIDASQYRGNLEINALSEELIKRI